MGQIVNSWPAANAIKYMFMNKRLFALIAVNLCGGRAYENEKDIRFGNFVRKLASISEMSRVITVANSDGNDLTMRESFNRIQLQ